MSTISAVDGAFVDKTQCQSLPCPGMVWIPGRAFRMGPDRHDPGEAPVHRVAVGGLWMDAKPVTHRRLHEFVRATAHISIAERRPDLKDYPGAPSVCRRHRPAAPHPEPADTSTSHLGFRCVVRGARGT